MEGTRPCSLGGGGKEVVAWMEFKLTYYDSPVQHFNHNTPTPQKMLISFL